MASGIIGTMASGFLLFYAGFSGTMASGISKENQSFQKGFNVITEVNLFLKM